ncbi:MAG: sulfurtransferase TusA family protein [Armatimonadetes bacterium]|nr:sulfurtransferase TusA family protein [Armatimonadota bacterium]
MPKQKPRDLSGMPCAFVLAEIDRALAEADVVEILCEHPTTINESVPAYCASHGHKLTSQMQVYPLDRKLVLLRIERPNPDAPRR